MATIGGVYLALFGRPADPGGLDYFNGVTRNGTDLSGIGDLSSQDEYVKRFTGFSNQQIVEAIYKSLFGRDGDAAGVNYFVSRLDAGELNTSNIAIAILDGALGADKATIDNKLAASSLFTVALDLPSEIERYKGTEAAQVGRQFLSIINQDVATVPSQAQADAAIASLLGGGNDTGGSAFTVQQVLDGAAAGVADYKVSDGLEAIVAHPETVNGHAYSLTNSIGGVGALTVTAAVILNGATNENDFDFSLADSQAAIKGASAAIIAEADTIAVVGTSESEVLDFSSFSRGVILSGNAGSDTMLGSKFNDAMYGGLGNNVYKGGGGSDTFVLDPQGQDNVFLTSATIGSLKTASPIYVQNIGTGDKIFLSDFDMRTDPGSSWTKDDFTSYDLKAEPNGNFNADVGDNRSDAWGLIEFRTVLSSQADLSTAQNGSELMQGLNENGMSASAIRLMSGWYGFVMAYDNGNTYIYYGDAGADGLMTGNEMNLVMVLQGRTLPPGTAATLDLFAV